MASPRQLGRRSWPHQDGHFDERLAAGHGLTKTATLHMRRRTSLSISASRATGHELSAMSAHDSSDGTKCARSSCHGMAGATSA